MCPDGPLWDSRRHTLTVYVKCGEGRKFDCLTLEDQRRGCVKTTLKVKTVSKRDDDDKVDDDADVREQKFRNSVFF